MPFFIVSSLSNTPIHLLRSNPCIITLVKSQIFSRRKGKEVVFDPLATRDVGKEVVYSDSDQFDEEEA